MRYAKNIVNLLDYGITFEEAMGYRYLSPIEKYGVVGSKLLISAAHDSDPIVMSKEVTQAGISVMCGIYGYSTGDRRTAAQIEFTGKTLCEVATWLFKRI